MDTGAKLIYISNTEKVNESSKKIRGIRSAPSLDRSGILMLSVDRKLNLQIF